MYIYIIYIHIYICIVMDVDTWIRARCHVGAWHVAASRRGSGYGGSVVYPHNIKQPSPPNIREQVAVGPGFLKHHILHVLRIG